MKILDDDGTFHEIDFTKKNKKHYICSLIYEHYCPSKNGY